MGVVSVGEVSEYSNNNLIFRNIGENFVFGDFLLSVSALVLRYIYGHTHKKNIKFDGLKHIHQFAKIQYFRLYVPFPFLPTLNLQVTWVW